MLSVWGQKEREVKQTAQWESVCLFPGHPKQVLRVELRSLKICFRERKQIVFIVPESANCLPISSSSFSVITLVFVHKISQLDLPASLAAWCDQIVVSEKSADACVTSRNSSLRENFSLHPFFYSGYRCNGWSSSNHLCPWGGLEPGSHIVDK